jgi:hypothetical protein
MTARSSWAVLPVHVLMTPQYRDTAVGHARTARISSRSFIDMLTCCESWGDAGALVI